ncbi:DUF4352 domain-containing protein [Nocardiopsis sp. CNS-639]|uniref:DUF4352 domain-containing protein n=1 Tax=Nocardiopsis sp. CNS-639 TaxID=1169153 RepID=UPI000376F388|nr:DUF4352 domain-containing protein [Nocardiopsis sp. CNS-639]
MYGEPPNGPQYPRQPSYGQQPPRGRRAWPWVLLGCGAAALLVLVLAIACSAVLFSGGDSEREQPGGETEEGAAESVSMGEPGTVGQWRVVVDGIETTSSHGGEHTTEQAQGEFKVVDVTVENTGDRATVFDSSAVSLIDAEGNTYSSSTLVDDAPFLEQINPGNRISGSAVFDVPEGTEITEVRVEDLFSLEEPLVIRAE